MKNNTAKLEDILGGFKDRHRQLDTLVTFTKDMEEAIEKNDLESLGTILTMRRKSMDRIDAINMEIAGKLDRMDEDARERVKHILDSESGVASFESPLEEEVFKLNRTTLAAAHKLVALDKKLNEKIRRNMETEMQNERETAIPGDEPQKSRLDIGV